MSVQSQDVYAAPGVTLTAVGTGGGGALPANAEVSTISALGLLNVSSINGSAYIPGAVPENPSFQTISTMAINLLSSINGVPYVAGGVPANLTVSSISTLALNNVSSINGAAYVAGGVPANLAVSTISTLGLAASTINNAAPPRSLGGYNLVVPPFSTQYGEPFFPGATILNFPVTPGHTYRVDINTRIAPTQPSVDPATVPADAAIAFTVAAGTTNLKADTIPASDIYRLSRNNLSSFNASYSIPFLAQGTPAIVQASYLVNNANNFNFTNSTLISSLGSAVLVDLGIL
jgi:hypothetical protein